MTPADLIPLALLAVVFWLLILRPMKTRQKQLTSVRQMQSALQPGQRVMLASGIHGTIAAIDDDRQTVELEIAPGTVITVARAAVAEVAPDESPELPAEPEA